MHTSWRPLVRSRIRPLRSWRGLLLGPALLSVLVPGLASANVALPGRAVLTLACVLLVPGVAIAALLRPRGALPSDGCLSAAVAVGASLACWLVTSTALLVVHLWDPLLIGWSLAGLQLALLLPAWRVSQQHEASAQAAEHAARAAELAAARARQGAAAAAAAAASATPPSPSARRRNKKSPARSPKQRPLPVGPPLPTPIGGNWGRLAAVAPTVLPLAALAAALELWWYATRVVQLGDMGRAGLISVVGIPYLLAVLLAAGVAASQLGGRDLDPCLMGLAAATLVVILFGFPNVADSEAGFRTAWIHVGFIRYITEHRATAAGFDARFSWPGFFAAGAALVRLAGLADASPLLRLAPVVYNLLAVPALLVIGRALTSSAVAAWLGVLLYLCFNWFSQDYLSPQATVFLMYVAMLALVLRTSRPTVLPDLPLLRRLYAEARRLPERAPGLSTAQAVGAELVLVLLGVATVVSHQLTPVTMIGVLLVFGATGGTRYRQLWLLLALAFLAWFSFGATDFWRGHLSTVFGDVGKLGATLNSSVGTRLKGDAVHGRMQQLRLVWSASSIGLAACGLWLQHRRPRLLPHATLAFAPFGLLAVQSYGGEVALRTFVYAQPAVAPLAALSLVTVVAKLPAVRLRVGAWCLLLTGAALILTATRGANDGFERVTAGQVSVARSLLLTMPPGSRIGLLADAGPLGLQRLTDFESVDLGPDTCGPDLVLCVRRRRPDYLYVTSTQDVIGQLQFAQPPGWTTQVVDRLVDLGLYRRTWRTDDAVVLKRQVGRTSCPCRP